MRLVAYILIVLAFGSCATVFNSKKKIVTIHADRPMHMVVDKDTISGLREELDVVLKRKKDPFCVTLYNDTFSKTIKVNSRNSLAYWLNAYPGYTFIFGFIVDRKNPKRYTYPSDVYIDLADKEHDYHTSIHHFDFRKDNFTKDEAATFYSNQLKLGQHLLFGRIRGITLSYERQYGKNRATELSASYIMDLLAGTDLSTWNKMYGYALGLEQKRFYSKSKYTFNYLSVNANMRNCQFEIENSFRIKNPQDSVEEAHQHLDTVMVKHKTYNLTFNWGTQLYYKRLVIDLRIGIGIKYRDVTHLNKLHPDDVLDAGKDVTIYNSTVDAWTGIIPCLPVRFKIGYRF